MAVMFASVAALAEQALKTQQLEAAFVSAKALQERAEEQVCSSKFAAVFSHVSLHINDIPFVSLECLAQGGSVGATERSGRACRPQGRGRH